MRDKIVSKKNGEKIYMYAFTFYARFISHPFQMRKHKHLMLAVMSFDCENDANNRKDFTFGFCTFY